MEEEQEYLELNPDEFTNPEEIRALQERLKKERQRKISEGVFMEASKFADEEEKEEVEKWNYFLAKYSGYKPGDKPIGELILQAEATQKAYIESLREQRIREQEARKAQAEAQDKQDAERLRETYKRIEGTVRKTVKWSGILSNEDIKRAKQDPPLNVLLNDQKQGFEERIVTERERMKAERDRDTEAQNYLVNAYPTAQISGFVEGCNKLLQRISVIQSRGGQATSEELAELDYESFFSDLLSIMKTKSVLGENMPEEFVRLMDGDIRTRRDSLNRKFERGEQTNNYSFFTKYLETVVKTWLNIFEKSGQYYSIKLIGKRHELRSSMFEEKVNNLTSKNQFSAGLWTSLPKLREVISAENVHNFFDALKPMVLSQIGITLPLSDENLIEKREVTDNIEKLFEGQVEPLTAGEISNKLKISETWSKKKSDELSKEKKLSRKKHRGTTYYASQDFDWKQWKKSQEK